MIDLNKLIEIWISRKDGFKKAAERAKRREDYFKDIKAIEGDNDLDTDQKRVLKDSAAQKLSGSSLVNYQLVSYFYRNSLNNNFEINAEIIAFWGTCITYYNLDDGYITRMELNPVIYWANLFMCLIACMFFLAIDIFLVIKGGDIVNFFSTSFHINASIIGTIYCVILLIIFAAILFFFYLLITLSEVKTIVE